MEALLENTHELKGKMKEKIEANKELGMLSKELAKIILDVPVTFEPDAYKLSDPNFEAVQPLFEELEFRRMQETIHRIFNASETVAAPVQKTAAASPTPEANNGQMDLFATAGAGTTAVEETTHSKQTLGTTSHAYQCIDSPLALSLLLEKLHAQKSVCFDTETTSLNALQAELVGIAFSWENHKGYYLPFPADQEEVQKLIEQVRPFFEHPDIEKIGHNLKYDIKVLSNYNIGVKGPFIRHLNRTLFDQSRSPSRHGYSGSFLPQLRAQTHY